MIEQNQTQLPPWNNADQLRGAMEADDFRDYMLSWSHASGSKVL